MAAVESPASNPTQRARQTVARIRSALDAGKSAGIAQIVELIREVTCKFETISVQALGEVIGRDLLTMSRVISVAHTLGFNPEGVEISTINQAIHVIGFNKIRNLALSLMLMQNVSSAVATEKRNVAALALVSGLIAQGVRARQHPQDAEEAFVCTALRNYGRIMMANFMPDEYRAVRTAATKHGEDAAFREHFGCTPLELTLALFEQVRMPRNILHGLREVTPATRNAPLSREMELPVIADFADALSRLIAHSRADHEAFEVHAARLVGEYGANVALSAEELEEVLREVGATLQMFGALAPGNGLSCPLIDNLSRLTGGRAVTNTIAISSATPAEASAPVELRSGVVAEPEDTGTKRQKKDAAMARIRDPLAAAVARLKELHVVSAHAAKAYSVALRAAHEAFKFSHTLVFRRDPETRRFIAWLGEGDLFQLLRGEELLDEEERNVFSVCLRRGEDVIIQNPSDPKIRPFIPEWLRTPAGSQPLVLLPVRDDRTTVALFCGLRNGSGGFLLNEAQARLLHTLRVQLREFEMMDGVKGGTADARAAG